MNNTDLPGLYVHVPFCGSKCPYCDFFSITSYSLIPQWLEAVEKEVLFYRGRFPLFDSLYLGGGTPSLLHDNSFQELVDILFRHFAFSPDSEVTIEVNPEDVTAEKAAFFRGLGFNRISLGVQSFDDKELRFLKRRHSAQQAVDALEAFALSGFRNLGIDLIYGLPGQSESSWQKSLERALGFNPAHLSCYQFTIAEGTPFGQMRKESLIAPLGEERERAFFLLTSQYLKERGFIHYEISNFAAEKGLMGRHNCKYWHRIPYLGLGPSAHSFSEGQRWWNVRSVENYCQSLAAGKPPVEGAERLSREQQELEILSLGFRTTEGVDQALVYDFPQADRIVKELRDSGLVVFKDEKIIPTREGFLVADSLPLLFCP